jgi:aryl-alcohol dehydrogenase-like predicted oxidoreductase
MFDAVSTIIPGASNVTQLNSNVAASDFEPLTLEEMTKIRDVYDEDIAPYVHHQW